jgi:hypothetical protein
MVLAFITLSAGAWAGLIRLGLGWPSIQTGLFSNHGPLMVAGFFGTLVALERAVAIDESWMFASPVLNSLGAILVVLGIFDSVGRLLVTIGSVLLVVLFLYMLWNHRVGFVFVLCLGAITLLVGNLFWLIRWPIHRFVFWWAGFLILTIAGERLELGRIIKKPSYGIALFYSFVSVMLAGLIGLIFIQDLGVRVLGFGMVGLALWLLRFDVARKTIKRSGLTRFIALCLLSGYFWLLTGGVLAIIYGGEPAGPVYDTMLHSIFLGFVFSMIFGHAPIIFPAVVGMDIKYRPIFYLPLLFLHGSLLLRTAGGMSGFWDARIWGGLFNVISVIIYVIVISPIFRKRQ